MLASEKKPLLQSLSDHADEEDVCSHLVELLSWHKRAFEAVDEDAYTAVLKEFTANDAASQRASQQRMVKGTKQCKWLNGIADLYTDLWSDAQESSRIGWKEAPDGHENMKIHLRALARFWNAEYVTMEFLESMMSVLGPSVAQLLDAMCPRLTGNTMRNRRLQKSRGGEVSIKLAKVDGSNSTWLQGLTKAIEMVAQKDADDDTNDRRFLARLWKSMFELSYKEKVEVFVCGRKFFGSRDSEEKDNDTLLEIALLLVQAPGSRDNIKLLETPFGQAISANCWDLAFPQYVWQRTMDFLNILFLCWFLTPICHATHSEHPVWMDRWRVTVVLYFCLRGIVNVIIELISMWWFTRVSDKPARSFARWLFFGAYANSFTIITLLVELWTVRFGLWLAIDFYAPPGHFVDHSESYFHCLMEFVQGVWADLVHCPDNTDEYLQKVKLHIVDTVLYKKPVAFAMIIFTKWCILMMTLLNFRKLSKTALPAWHAIKSGESVWFLTYLLMLTFGCMLAYYALPVPDIGGSESSNTIDAYALAFTRIFRLTLMGDFDMWSLEGVDDRLKFPEHLINATIDIENGRVVREMHKSLRVWVLMLALVFPVVLLNVYVGIIGKVYEDAKEANIAIAGHFRIISCFRLLLHRRFWRHCCSCLSLDNCMSLCSPKRSSPEAGDQDDVYAFMSFPVERLLGLKHFEVSGLVSNNNSVA